MIIKFLDEDLEVVPVECPLCDHPICFTPLHGGPQVYFSKALGGTSAGNMTQGDDGEWRHEICPT